MVFIRRNWLFLTLLFMGLVVRFLFMKEQGFSNDELSALCRTRFNSLGELWENGVKNGDMHPAFYQTLLWIWIKIFGENEFLIRLLSLIFYVANSWLIYRISCKYFSKESGVLITALYAGLSFTVMNTVFARPYNSGTFFLLVSLFSILELKTVQSGKWKFTLLLTFGLIGAMLSHYFAFWVAFVLGVCSIFFVGKRNIKYVLIAGFVATVCFLPHLRITDFQLAKGGLQWLDPPGWMWLPDFTKQFMNDSWVIAGVIFSIFILLFLKFGKIRPTDRSVLLLAVFMLSFFGAVAISYAYTPILRDLVMLFILPFLLIPVMGSLKIKQGLYFELFAILFVLLVSVDSVFRDRILEPDKFGVFKEIGEQIDRADKEFSRDSIGYASNFNSVDYINYYVEQDLKEELKDWLDQRSLAKVHDRVEQSRTPYFCYSFNHVYHSPLYLEIIRKYYPGLERSYLTRFSSYYLFTKKKERQLPAPFASIVPTDSVETTMEYFGFMQFRVGDLPVGKGYKNYFLVKCDGTLLEEKPFYMVVTLARDGKMVMSKEEQPVFYLAFDQSIVQEAGIKGEFFTAFELPDKARESDEIQVSFWNPERVRVRTGTMKIYLTK